MRAKRKFAGAETSLLKFLKPFFMTVMQKLLNNGTDVEITVFSWDANGAAAPKIAFNWRCRVEHPIVIL